jgi:ribosome biogenesis GTPase A
MTDHAQKIKIAAAMVLALPDVPGVVHRRGKEIMEHTDALAAERDALLAYAEELERMVAAFTNQNAALLAEALREQNGVAHLFGEEGTE